MTIGNMLEWGLDWLNDQAAEHITKQIVYRRGAYSVTLDADLGSQVLRTSDGRGNTKIERTDLTASFETADLVLNGSQAYPARGDTIDVTLRGITKRYEVLPLQGESPWRFADLEKRIIVHAKFTTTV